MKTLIIGMIGNYGIIMKKVLIKTYFSKFEIITNIENVT